jgi:hypothetical protein
MKRIVLHSVGVLLDLYGCPRDTPGWLNWTTDTHSILWPLATVMNRSPRASSGPPGSPGRVTPGFRLKHLVSIGRGVRPEPPTGIEPATIRLQGGRSTY